MKSYISSLAPLTVLVIILGGSCRKIEPLSTQSGERQLLTQTILDDAGRRVEFCFLREKCDTLVRAPIAAPLNTGRPPFCRGYEFSLLLYAMQCFWLEINIDSANAALLEYASYHLDNPATIYDRDNYRFSSEVPFRLIELFGPNGTRHSGLLSDSARKGMMEVGWLYCKRDPSVQSYYNAMSEPDYQVSDTWYVMGSENHHAQDVIAQWHFAKLAKDDPDFKDRLYFDGHKPEWYFDQWQAYLNMYYPERAKKGLLIEMMSPIYNVATLKGMFNVYDFAEDTELRRKAGLYLDLYFAYWAEEQLDGISGGGKARIYTSNDVAQATSPYGYFFFGLGDMASIDCTVLSGMTTTYRPPALVADIAVDIQGRGVYEVLQRPLGLAVPGYNSPNNYRMRTDSGGIVRYTYCTPDFIMGSALCEARPKADWTDISAQNRSNGVIFSESHRTCILPQCEKLDGRANANAQWAVQYKGTMISQKLSTGVGAGNMAVWFSEDLLSDTSQQNGWVFASTNGAYAAVRVVEGTTQWVEQTNPVISRAHGKWLYCNSAYSPVILEVARSSEYASFAAFQDSVKTRPLAFSNDVLHYKSIYGNSLTFYADYTQVPEVNGSSVNYAPVKAFDSPFLEADWNSGIVTIRKGTQSTVLDFNE